MPLMTSTRAARACRPPPRMTDASVLDAQTGIAPMPNSQNAYGVAAAAISRPAIAPSTIEGMPASRKLKISAAVPAMTRACTTSADASSRLPAPSVRAMAETTPPPIAPADICCIISANGSTTAQALSAAVP